MCDKYFPPNLPFAFWYCPCYFSYWLFRKYKNVLHKPVPMLTPAVRQGDKFHVYEMESENRS